MWWWLDLITLLILKVSCTCSSDTTVSNRTPDDNVESIINHPGHLRPFGFSGPHLKVDEWQGYPDTRTFFLDYVRVNRPLIMRGAGQLSPAFSLWTDDYLKLAVENLLADEIVVHVEAAKKENRSGLTVDLTFTKFLDQYRDESVYMVDTVPPYLRQDVVIPGPLQCDHIYKNLIVDMVMWMSSGGTSSVVHTDNVDNIICVFDGEKSLVMVDPVKHKHKIMLDHPHGAYSGIDVDRVDYDKYAGLVDVEYYVANLGAGDCLYIPYLWIHQVRSYGRNIAVNVWWDHYQSLSDDVDLYSSQSFSPRLTLDLVNERGPSPITAAGIPALKDHLSAHVYKELSLLDFISGFFGDGGPYSDEDNKSTQAMKHLEDNEQPFILPLKQIFLIVDKNEDGKITPSDLILLSDKDWTIVGRQLERFESIMEEEQQQEIIDETIERKEEERRRLKTEL